MKIQCPFCPSPNTDPNEPRTLSKNGKYWRKSDGHWVHRFWCGGCRKSFTRSTLSPQYRQKKRHKNNAVLKQLCVGTSLRATARLLCLNRKTVVRKLLFLEMQESANLEKWNQKMPLATEVEFDDLETFEHTKCKPISVTLMVEHKARRVIGFEVSSMPAKGNLAKISLKKYGPRKDGRPLARQQLFEKVKPFLAEGAVIRSDSNPHYTQDVKTHFPKSPHITVLSRRSAITGQGELKKTKFDPIFSLNHTCAMLRYCISRLIRKTWCTTKKMDRLRAHIALYVMAHNRRVFTG